MGKKIGFQDSLVMIKEKRSDYLRTKGLYEEIVERKPSWEDVVLTDSQTAEIEKIYGKGIDTRWHRYYQGFTGTFEPRYLPEPVYSPALEKKLNPKQIAMAIEDKILIPILYGNIPGVVIPETVVSNASGIYYDRDGNVISEERANELVKAYLEEHQDAVIKPILDSYGGDGVMLLEKDSFRKIPHSRNFIVQKRIHNQKDMHALNPSSLNTLRVITYICDNQYWTAPIAMRMGTTPALTDNISAGGMTVGVQDDGSLCKCAYTERNGCKGEAFELHPLTKIRFEGYRIGNIDKVIQAAIACHKRTPHMRMASWDFTLNEAGEAVLIEVNLTSQSVCFPQYTHGKALFGENTEKMLKLIAD